LIVEHAFAFLLIPTVSLQPSMGWMQNPMSYFNPFMLWLHYPDGKNETKCKQHLQVDHQTLQVLQFSTLFCLIRLFPIKIISTHNFADKGVFSD